MHRDSGIIEEDEREDDEDEDVDTHTRGRRATFGGAGGRPVMVHTKSDTNIMARFGNKTSPPRAATFERVESTAPEGHGSTSFTVSQRTGASNNLVDMANTAGPSGINGNAMTRNGSGISLSHQRNAAMPGDIGGFPQYQRSESSNIVERSGSSDTASSGRSDSDTASHLNPVTPAYTFGMPPYVQGGAIPPQKKHISFNAIVEQCIAIEGGSAPDHEEHAPVNAKQTSWSGWHDDG